MHKHQVPYAVNYSVQIGVVYMLGMCYTSEFYPQSLFQRFIYMCEYLHVCIRCMCVPSACRGHKKAKDPLEQEL